jgi:hypothetical protein
MSLSLPPIGILPAVGPTNGVYKIFNVQYPNQVADLVYPGGANGAIVGYNSANDLSKRVQVCISNPSNHIFTNDDTRGCGLVERHECCGKFPGPEPDHIDQPGDHDIRTGSPGGHCEPFLSIFATASISI